MFRFVSNWNILAPITHGYIETNIVDDNLEVSYYINFKQMLVMVSAFIFIVFVFALVFASSDSIEIKFGFPLLMWLWGFCLNYLIIVIR